MIYLDNGATTLHKPPEVTQAVTRALSTCGNPGRGGHTASMQAAKVVYQCREKAAKLFDCSEEQVTFTTSCTHGLNIAIRSLVKPGDTVVVSGFEHNAVMRPLYALGAKIKVAGRQLFDPDDTLEKFEKAVKSGAKTAIFTHISNVFGYILPVKEMAEICKKYAVPFIVDAAQSAGYVDISLEKLGADFIAMPGHKGLLGPMGTGLLLCAGTPAPLLFGGTGSVSKSFEMPTEMPDILEAGTLNVPGIAGLCAGIDHIQNRGILGSFRREQGEAKRCAEGLKALGFTVFSGENQAGTVSFLPPGGCEECADFLSQKGIAVRAGLHCAPLAHQSAGTLETGTVRLSFGHDVRPWQTDRFLREILVWKDKKISKNYCY